jgi:CheY-like chemotaxis protein
MRLAQFRHLPARDDQISASHVGIRENLTGAGGRVEPGIVDAAVSYNLLQPDSAPTRLPYEGFISCRHYRGVGPLGYAGRVRFVRVRIPAGKFLRAAHMSSKPRILVIDDDESARATIDAVLTRARYNVALAESGDEGIAQLQSKEFDLVVCDVAMPEKDGFATLRILKAIAPTVPVVMMAGDSADGFAFADDDLDYFETTLARGDAEIIAKPLLGSNLVALIYDCLAHRSAEIH